MARFSHTPYIILFSKEWFYKSHIKYYLKVPSTGLVAQQEGDSHLEANLGKDPRHKSSGSYSRAEPSRAEAKACTVWKPQPLVGEHVLGTPLCDEICEMNKELLVLESHKGRVCGPALSTMGSVTGVTWPPAITSLAHRGALVFPSILAAFCI